MPNTSEHGAAQGFEQNQVQQSEHNVTADELNLHGDPSLQESAFDLDAVLDDIELTLEENAQDYVNSFVQKGGE